MSHSRSVVIIAGPTASGKSDFAEDLARQKSGEIVNADAVQMFTKVSIGTAKPDWRSSDIPHHLFDICDRPRDFDVVQYRAKVKDIVEDIWGRGKLPILVGGSLFYIKSLFYPPIGKTLKSADRSSEFDALSDQQAWDELHKIDPVRARQLHVNDRYRVVRALQLWESTGTKPSELKPVYEPLFKISQLLFLSPPLETLYERINTRTVLMIEKMGWLDEARDCMQDAEWKGFIQTKGFIGYPEIFAWLESGQHQSELPALIETIQQKTRQYAKRQRTFWNSFCSQVRQDDSQASRCSVTQLEPPYNLT